MNEQHATSEMSLKCLRKTLHTADLQGRWCCSGNKKDEFKKESKNSVSLLGFCELITLDLRDCAAEFIHLHCWRANYQQWLHQLRHSKGERCRAQLLLRGKSLQLCRESHCQELFDILRMMLQNWKMGCFLASLPCRCCSQLARHIVSSALLLALDLDLVYEGSCQHTISFRIEIVVLLIWFWSDLIFITDRFQWDIVLPTVYILQLWTRLHISWHRTRCIP